MAVAVADASALAAIAFAEPASDSVVVRIAGKAIAAPSILPYELANVAVTKQRRGHFSLEQASAALALVTNMGITLHSVAAEEILDAASLTGLTAYDASYWWLAHVLRAEWVTLDRNLENAFRKRS